MRTLVSRIERALERGGSVTFVTGESSDRVEWSQLYEDATVVAASLQARGVGPGSHVALLGPTTRSFVTTIEAVWLAGATLVALPLPMRLGSVDEFVANHTAYVASLA